ncbi:tape measure protein [Rhizobium leguminosarum]|uniref:tape measure protein n=1 Tax=Rhizobium leguminosarum TaxID=384 RepID=UPI001AE9604E|nr:tape measure protein [Rhizobium leguminosarum]MBP2446386.1 tape measure domain-containing protein [Rhizobium leguminosarum]
MADDGQQLLLTFDAKFERYLRNFERAQQQTDRRFRAMEQRSKQASDRMESAFAKAGSGIRNTFSSIGNVFAGIVSAKATKDLIDSSIKIQNQLKTTGLAGKELKGVYDELFASAWKNATPLEALVTLYSRTSGAAKDLGASQQDLLRFTDGVSLAMRVSGQSASESAGALLQLSQALGGGKIQAEEYNSLLDAGRPILQAVAAGLSDAGGSVSNLTKLVKDGKVSSEAFFRAFLAGLPTLQQQVAGSEATISSSFVRLQNVLIDAAGRFDHSAKASKAFGSVIDGVAASISAVNFDNLITQIEAVTTAVQNSIATLNSWADTLGTISGAGNLGDLIVSSLPGDTTVKNVLGMKVVQTDQVQRRITDAFDAPATNSGGLTPEQIKAFASNSGAIAGAEAAAKVSRLPAAPNAPAAVKPVSLADYPIAPTSAAPSSAGRGGSGGRSGRDSFASDLQELQSRTQALQSATAAQAALNPLIDDYGAALATAQAKQQLMNAAQQQNKTVTPEMAAQIDVAAQAYGRATAAAEQLQEQQDAVRRSAEEALGTARDVTQGLITDLASGKSGAEALSNALAKIGDAILNNLLDKVFDLKNFTGTGSAGGGFLGVIGSLLGFSDGGYTGDGGKHEPKGVVHGGEFVVTKEATRRIGVQALNAMNYGRVPGYAEGGYVGSAPALRKPDLVVANGNAAPVQQINISSAITVNGSAGTPEQNTDLARKMAREYEQSMRGVVADEIRKQTRPGAFMNQRAR